MTTESMTIHRALVELKTIDSRIEKLIREARFCSYAKKNAKKVQGVDIEDFIGSAKSSYDKISDLIKRRNAIKAAVSKSNSTTEVKIGDAVYTVAEAIAMKQHGMDLWLSLCEAMERQYSESIRMIEQENSGLDSSADKYINMTYGGKEAVAELDPEILEKARQGYINARQLNLVDGLSGGQLKSVKDTFEHLEEMIDTFENEVDSALSVSNATTTIEISY